jgi:hypothetical protein
MRIGKVLCWLRIHRWRAGGTKTRTAPEGDMLPGAQALTETCARCGKVADLAVDIKRGETGKTYRYHYRARARSRAEKFGDAMVIMGALLCLGVVGMWVWEYLK